MSLFLREVKMSSKNKTEKKSTSGKAETKTSDKPVDISKSDAKKSDAKSEVKTSGKLAKGAKAKSVKAKASTTDKKAKAKAVDKAEKTDQKVDKKKSTEVKTTDKSVKEENKVDEKSKEVRVDDTSTETAKTDKADEGVVKEQKTKTAQAEQIKLSGLYAFKLGMSSIYDEKGQFTPVTLLQMKPCFVSQIKTQKKEGYSSVQVACKPQKNNRASKPLVAHLSAAGFKEGAAHVKEIRQSSIENIKVGQEVSINSLEKGDIVKLTGVSKGHGFAGVVKRWGFKGGPASHGAKTHRTTGSIGNRTEPARVMPGKKMPGHYGVEQVSLRNVKVMDVVPNEKLILVKGPVPGARNSLVYLHKNQPVEKRKS